MAICDVVAISLKWSRSLELWVEVDYSRRVVWVGGGGGGDK